jgi:hypothetical protein
MARALALLDAIPEGSLTQAQRASAARIRERFGDNPPDVPGDLPPVSAHLLRAYRAYWREVMLRRSTPAEGEAALLRELAAILGPVSDLDGASDAARAAIEGEGLRALTGVTLPYHELMIWRRDTPCRYHVPLPERDIDVDVVFLDEFVSLGWAAYATAERSHTGGWATPAELYAVRQAYDVDSESFRVSYLAHEAQHFADYPRFPKLAQPELEYRAKLTEIALSDATTRSLVERFAARRGTDRAVPHHFAHHFLVRSLAEVLEVADPAEAEADAIRAAARSLLFDSTRALESCGAESVERWLGV